jgi:nicotine blue oxidoreductase
MQVGLILAAGSGSRVGTPKAILEISGERLIDRAVTQFHNAGIRDVYVVLGAWQGEVPGAHVIVNPEWKSGMGSSLRTGLEYLAALSEITDVVVSLVDLPGLSAAAIEAIVRNTQEIVMGTFYGKPGHPVKFARKHWKEIAESATGDFGARNFLKGRDDVFTVPLETLAVGKDLDTPEDLAAFKDGL